MHKPAGIGWVFKVNHAEILYCSWLYFFLVQYILCFRGFFQCSFSFIHTTILNERFLCLLHLEWGKWAWQGRGYSPSAELMMSNPEIWVSSTQDQTFYPLSLATSPKNISGIFLQCQSFIQRGINQKFSCLLLKKVMNVLTNLSSEFFKKTMHWQGSLGKYTLWGKIPAGYRKCEINKSNSKFWKSKEILFLTHFEFQLSYCKNNKYWWLNPSQNAVLCSCIPKSIRATGTFAKYMRSCPFPDGSYRCWS